MSTVTVQTIESLNPAEEVAIPSLDQRMAKAWARIDNGSMVIKGSLNVSSITDLGVGSTKIHYEKPVGGGNVVTGTSSLWGFTVTQQNTSDCSISSGNSGGTPLDATDVNVLVFSN